MDNRELRKLAREFYLRHRPVWEYVRQTDPGFWTDLWDTQRVAQEIRWDNAGDGGDGPSAEARNGRPE